MVTRLFKLSAVLLGCVAALGTARAAVADETSYHSSPRTHHSSRITFLASPALPTMRQCFFQPDGYFYQKGSPTEGFANFDYLELRTLISGARRPPADSHLYTKDGKSYRFAKFADFDTHSSGWGLTFDFETEPLEGVSYRFSGKFSSICFFAEDERDPKKTVAEGRIAKFRDSREVATAAVQFTYSGVRQKNVRYPRDVDDVIAFVEAFSQVDLSVNDAIKNLGTNPVSDDPKQGHILLMPLPSDQTMIKRAVLNIFESKPDRLEIEYSEPILISYGALKEKYGSPKYLKPPLVGRCNKPRADCQPAFAGYSFSFIPDSRSLASNERLEVAVDLRMNSSDVVPQHTDKDFLAVKEIRFRRICRGL